MIQQGVGCKNINGKGMGLGDGTTPQRYGLTNVGIKKKKYMLHLCTYLSSRWLKWLNWKIDLDPKSKFTVQKLLLLKETLYYIMDING